MKCSRRKAPIGTTPVSECKRRSRNDVPWPARKGATPDLILEATGLAVDATITAPYVVRCANWVLSFCTGREVKDSLIFTVYFAMARVRRRPLATPAAPETPLRDGYIALSLARLVRRTSSESRGRKTVDRIRNRFRREAR